MTTRKDEAMKLILFVSRPDGKAVFVNPSHITHLTPGTESGTKVHLSSGQNVVVDKDIREVAMECQGHSISDEDRRAVMSGSGGED